MKNSILICKGLCIILTTFLICISVFVHCAGSKPDLRAAFYNFQYKGIKYNLRSYSSNNDSLSFNELQSVTFLGKDYDRDGFLDEITVGKINIDEAQKIYEYALSTLAMENKLRKIDKRSIVFKYENSENKYEIKSFLPADSEPFNQIKIINNVLIGKPDIIICIDEKADGTLDKIVKGTIILEEIQHLYSKIIKKGLEEKELIRIDNRILVNTK